jgi:hypothetical protein
MDKLSYLMGLFDGEGTICPAFRRDGYISLHVAVQMAGKNVLEMFKEQWGGSVSTRPAKPNRIELDTWTLTGSKAIPFLEFAKDNLLLKKEQARIALILASEMAKLTSSKREGLSCGRGLRLISDADMDKRKSLALQIRALNGARSRFSDFRRA